VVKMSIKRILKSLENLGLSKRDAEVYMYLAKNGQKTAREIMTGLGISKQKLYIIMKNLRNKNVVIVNNRRLSTFEAISFKKVLDLIIKIKKEQSEAILETKKELLSNWKKVDWTSNKNS
jgi:sugar-specific transcriptional regulator TrmB